MAGSPMTAGALPHNARLIGSGAHLLAEMSHDVSTRRTTRTNSTGAVRPGVPCESEVRAPRDRSYAPLLVLANEYDRLAVIEALADAGVELPFDPTPGWLNASVEPRPARLARRCMARPDVGT
jgi:hypothetical protein